MEPLPQIPTSKSINDTVCQIRDSFEDTLENEVFSADIANNLKTYFVDDDLSLKEIANKVVEVQRNFEEGLDVLNNAEYNIIKQHAEYLCTQNAMMKNTFLQEIMKLRPCEIFTSMWLSDKLKFGLIEKCDLYPDIFRQFLDFRFNTPLHQWSTCFPKADIGIHLSRPIQKLSFLDKVQEHLTWTTRYNNSDVEVLTVFEHDYIPKPAKTRGSSQNITGLLLKPAEITFSNFELNIIYQHTIKIKNISPKMQKVSIRTYPKLSVFTLQYDGHQKIAPGMCATATITFITDKFKNQQDCATFISRQGELLVVSIRCIRDPPKLSAVIHKSIQYSTSSEIHIPGEKQFSVRRQKSVNNTIDCGSCFATEHVLISLTILNTGNKAKFFWLPEEDFCYQDVNTVSTDLELKKGSFWIFPTFFEMLAADICEINIIFQPLDCGFKNQTFCLMCDNNTYRKIDLIGDGLCFTRDMISVSISDHINEIEKKEGHCVFLGHVAYKDNSTFAISIINKSSIYLKYDIKFEIKDEKFSMCDWIKITNILPTMLASYSTTDITFEIECPSDIPKGYYNTKLRLFVRDVPIPSLESDRKFVISTNGIPLKEVTKNMAGVDVLIMDVEVACYVDPETVLNVVSLDECEGCGNLDCTCKVCKEYIPLAELDFIPSILEFGILPVGVDFKKEFYIINMGSKESRWNIVELKYTIHTPAYVEILKEPNLSSYNGTLQPNKKHQLTYNVVRKNPGRYVSILVLFLENRDANMAGGSNLIAQSVCLVTYEIIKMNIIIETGQSEEPILCLLQMLYTGVPVNSSFKIRNNSLIPGCFYFLKPIGSDAGKVKVEYTPESGKLNPGSSREIHIKLTCFEVGILDNIFLPCFIGKNLEPVLLRLLCVVDCIHVFFYLPTKNNEFQKILWPPKVVYEYDQNWSDYCLCGEESYEFENTINSIRSDHEIQIKQKSNETLNDIKNSKMSIANATETSDDPDGSQDLLNTLVNMDSEIFLQDCVVEVKGIITRKPKKLTLHFENVTPKSAKYSIQSTNYSAKENNIKGCLGPKYMKTDELWEAMIKDYGIVIHPEVESGYMKPHELIPVNIWIYATTWGIYADEIIVDIENIASFSFSLVVEVVGCPLQLPMGMRAITQYPTIRFGSVAFHSKNIRRDVLIRNVSGLDLTLLWHVFYFNEKSEGATPFNFICDVDKMSSEEHFEFSLTDRFFGIEAFECLDDPFTSVLHWAPENVLFKRYRADFKKPYSILKLRLLAFKLLVKHFSGMTYLYYTG